MFMEQSAEAEAKLRNEKYMNKHLMGVFGKSTTVELNRLKNMRRGMDCRQLMTQSTNCRCSGIHRSFIH